MWKEQYLLVAQINKFFRNMREIDEIEFQCVKYAQNFVEYAFVLKPNAWICAKILKIDENMQIVLLENVSLPKKISQRKVSDKNWQNSILWENNNFFLSCKSINFVELFAKIDKMDFTCVDYAHKMWKIYKNIQFWPKYEGCTKRKVWCLKKNEVCNRSYWKLHILVLYNYRPSLLDVISTQIGPFFLYSSRVREYANGSPINRSIYRPILTFSPWGIDFHRIRKNRLHSIEVR